MAETLGSLCDKLTVVKLKQWHTSDERRSESLACQAGRLAEEIDVYVTDALGGVVDSDRITFPSNKVFDLGEKSLPEVIGSLGHIVSELARVNCELWHEQEKVYEIQRSPESHSDAVHVVRRLGALNLGRTQCIDAIDESLLKAVVNGASTS